MIRSSFIILYNVYIILIGIIYVKKRLYENYEV